MTERVLQGAPASPGSAVGTAWRLLDRASHDRVVAPGDRSPEREAALAALAAAAEELTRLAAELPDEEAAIVEASVLMAQDPALTRAVEEAISSRGLPAGDAILSATRQHADAIAQIGDSTLAARADDVRSLGRRASRLAASDGEPPRPEGPVVLVAQDVGPADVAELASVLAGVALAGGGATAHAAIVARSLGIPMVTNLGPLEVEDGVTLVLDGAGGQLVLDPAAERVDEAGAEMAARKLAQRRSLEESELPAVTTDGRRVKVLTNVASAAELVAGLREGAEGVGLLRTELAFLDVDHWPCEREHCEALEPILGGLDRRPAIVRVLDFGADKSPPFLNGTPLRGIDLLLANRVALISQLRAIVFTGQGRDIRIMLPMVSNPDQLATVRELLENTARAMADEPPPLGAMIETPEAADGAGAIAHEADFLSIGTNDLTAATLGADRFASGAAAAHDPRVLRRIEQTVAAAHEAGIPVEVCGEAASDPLMVPLLIGLDVDELSVGAARVGAVRRWIRSVSHGDARELALRSLRLGSADQVAAAGATLAASLENGSAETGDGGREGVERGGRVHAVGA
jgi:phosphoenolpyruvate-protein kinase (PTS system EI component)